MNYFYFTLSGVILLFFYFLFMWGFRIGAGLVVGWLAKNAMSKKGDKQNGQV